MSLATILIGSPGASSSRASPASTARTRASNRHSRLGTPGRRPAGRAIRPSSRCQAAGSRKNSLTLIVSMSRSSASRSGPIDAGDEQGVRIGQTAARGESIHTTPHLGRHGTGRGRSPAARGARGQGGCTRPDRPGPARRARSTRGVVTPTEASAIRDRRGDRRRGRGPPRRRRGWSPRPPRSAARPAGRAT